MAMMTLLSSLKTISLSSSSLVYHQLFLSRMKGLDRFMTHSMLCVLKLMKAYWNDEALAEFQEHFSSTALNRALYGDKLSQPSNLNDLFYLRSYVRNIVKLINPQAYKSPALIKPTTRCDNIRVKYISREGWSSFCATRELKVRHWGKERFAIAN